MSDITKNLETLLQNFLQAQKEHLVALYVFDRDGLVIGKYSTHNIILDKSGHAIGMSLSCPSYARGVMKV